jgi:hypothetical protein
LAARYNYIKKSGSLQEAMSQQLQEDLSNLAVQSVDYDLDGLVEAAEEQAPLQRRERRRRPAPPAPPMRTQAAGLAPADRMTRNLLPPEAIAREEGGRAGESRPPGGRPPGGLDPQQQRGTASMFFYTVPDGQRVLATDKNGRMEVIEGPARVLRWGRRFQPMKHYVAHPGDFLIVRFRDGRQEHLPGPAHCWFDPRVHLSVESEEAVQIADKEAVVVYSEAAGEGGPRVNRRIVRGPATFVPGPGEWLHTFSWHGPSGDGTYRKVPNALVFQKLWQMPDQMYHDVEEVRTADDAQLTIRLMIFFELRDIERMLESTHDPIGDFVNAATSDVVESLSRMTFDEFKRTTEALNELSTYRNLTARAAQCGYHIDKVVYRGYGAPEALQKMHDQATQSRVRLQLERNTERQSQELEDLKQDRNLARAAKERTEREREFDHKVALQQKALEAELAAEAARSASRREQERLDSELDEARTAARQARERAHLEALRGLQVDLTALLTQGRADKVIELRGGGAASAASHVHLPPDAID